MNKKTALNKAIQNVKNKTKPKTKQNQIKQKHENLKQNVNRKK